jgi:hypothetical protein
METLKDLFNRINELQQIINNETDAADQGCINSMQLVINAENEKEHIQDMIDQLAINSQLVY